MKKMFSVVLALIIAVLSATALAEPSLIKGKLKTNIKVKSDYPENAVVAGIDPLTGEKSTGEPYTPILMVLDNAEDAYPHWGIADASMMFQVPNSGKGATKLLALFSNHYPEIAGGARSARMTMLTVAKAFDAAFASGGYAQSKDQKASVEINLRKWGYNENGKFINLLGNYFKQREKFVKDPHNLSCKIKEIHEKLVSDNIAFTEHPFKFATEPLKRGTDAKKVSVKFYQNTKEMKRANNASCADYDYREGIGYVRTSASGENIDRLTNEPVGFANLIVMRIEHKSANGNPYFAKHMKGQGTAEIFQNGMYIQGAWMRKDDNSRIVFIDEDGSELALQPGKTFVVMGDQYTGVYIE